MATSLNFAIISGLPLVALSAAGVATVIVGLLWALHAWSVAAGKKELAAYKDQVVALSDRIDALKQRHKIVPFLDNKFSIPMSGETLAAYNLVAERLEHHRREWLKLMDVWEQAQSLLDSERVLGSRRARAARRSLHSAAAPTELKTLLEECEAPLDRIEHAHEQSAETSNLYDRDNQLLDSRLESLTAAALSIAPYQADKSAAAALVAQAKDCLPADPLGAVRCLTEARETIAALNRRATKILEHAVASRDVLKQIAEVQQLAVQRRSDGFLLREEGSDPDPLLAAASARHAAASAAMNQGDESAAGKAVSDAATAADQARQAIQRHVAARARCESQIPSAQHEIRRLADLSVQARGQHVELERDFAPEDWRAVARNTQHAQAILDGAEHLLGEAARCASLDAQRYLSACKQLDQATDQQQQAQAELSAVGNRLRELTELRGQCQAQIDQIQGVCHRVQRLLKSSTADRAVANERFRAARATLDRLLEESRQPRPRWTELTNRAIEVQADLERAEQLARQDLELAQHAAAEIDEAERTIREAAAFREQELSADVSAAQSQLGQARGCLMAQGYEEAIRLANAAARAARAAHQEARAQAQRLREEGQRRAQEAARSAPQALVYPPLQAEAEAPVEIRPREIQGGVDV